MSIKLVVEPVNQVTDKDMVKVVVDAILVWGGASIATGVAAGMAVAAGTEPVAGVIAGVVTTVVVARENYRAVVYKGKKLNPLA